MAMATGKSYCATCNKEKISYKCEGCSQYFCVEHLSDHHKSFVPKLDQIEDNRNILQENLNKQKIDSKKHFLIEQINQWKLNSIEKIEQTAKECENLLEKSLTEHIDQVQIILNKFTQKLQQIRKDNDFNEINVKEFEQKLKELEELLNKPSNISIEQASSTFIKEISVVIPSGFLSIPKLSANTRWIQNGVTVAGGNGGGSGLNQFCHPRGIYVDNDQTIYVADRSNHRIVEWKNGATTGQVVALRNGQENRTDQLFDPFNVIVDKENDSLIISDHGNRRVVSWSRRNSTIGETIISNVDCRGLAMDNNEYLYVSDDRKHEVRRWKIGETNGTLVAGGNGQGDRLDQLSNPNYIFVDEDQSVYVSDYSNHRAMKWLKGAKEGILVAGGQGEGNSLTQLSSPVGIIVDQVGTVYIADQCNHRVMRWLKGAKEGSIVVGGNDEGGQTNQLNISMDLSLDEDNNLYVLDCWNHRVQKFNIEQN